MYETMEYGGPPRPPRRGPSYWLIGGIVAALAVGGLIARDLVRDAQSGKPAAAPKPLVMGGTTTGQARELDAALTALKLECSVLFTGPEGGLAGCFQRLERGYTSAEVRFQYRSDGTVTGIDAKAESPVDGHDVAALKPLVAATAGVVFPADRELVNRAAGTNSSKFDGGWGSYRTEIGGPARFVAGKFGAVPVEPQRRTATTTADAATLAFKAQGFECGTDDCQTEYLGRPKGRVSIYYSDRSPDGIYYLRLSASSLTEDENHEEFSQLVDKAFNVVHGPGTTDVREWIIKHTDGVSRTVYVAGWRVEVIFYDRAENPEVSMVTDYPWNSPDL